MRELCIMSIKQTEAGEDNHYQDYNCDGQCYMSDVSYVLRSLYALVYKYPIFLGEGMGQDDTNGKGQTWNSNPPVCIARFQVGKSWDTQINSPRGVFLKRGELERGGQSLN